MSPAAQQAITAPYVEVAIAVPLRQLFTYAVPEALAGRLQPGSRVMVSFGRRKTPGIVVAGKETLEDTGFKIKPLLDVIDPEPIFGSELLAFLLEAARYYMHPVGDVLRMAAPALPREVISALRKSGKLEGKDKVKGAQLGTRRMTFVTLKQEPSADMRLGRSQKVVMALVLERGEISTDELGRHVRAPRTVVRALADKGLLDTVDREVAENPFFETPVPRKAGPPPNPEQKAAIEAMTARLGQGGAFLLHGVTGSGKTEVYLRVITAAREQGLGALILVPEIALTPQLVHRFRERFGDEIAVIHSELSERARDDAFRGLRAGRLHVAIGARSALFAPVQNLGVIAVDEEHDGSFKQEEGFRYHARDMALLRAHRASAVCILGSATPSLESMQLSEQGKVSRLVLAARATSQSLPQVEIVDLQKHRKGPSGHRLVSAPLYRALASCLEEKGQAILFLNRRGFAPALRCEACNEVQECPACSVGLTFHRGPGLLRCHYCDFERRSGGGCIKCGEGPLAELGLGTEQLEAHLQESFPDARVARLDRDTASGRGAEALMNKLRRGELDILVGTQMVTKGHDLPGVTLVGVIVADQSLSFPDFRAPERTFQLLSQVAGRAGRGDRPGSVILQTYQPDQPVLRWAKTHDFMAFCRAEMVERASHGFPPFSRLISVRVDALSEPLARSTAANLAKAAQGHPAMREGKVQLLGPAPAPIAKIRSRYRFRFLLRGDDRAALRSVGLYLADRIDAGLGHARATLDIDPVNML